MVCMQLHLTYSKGYVLYSRSIVTILYDIIYFRTFYVPLCVILPSCCVTVVIVIYDVTLNPHPSHKIKK